MSVLPQFITFEGGEGAGKSTQTKLLSAALTHAGIDHICTREPGGSEGAEAIRDLLVQGDKDRWHPITEMTLFMAARHDHVIKRIMPALAAGKWVICDRYLDSTRIYQGQGKGIPKETIERMYRLLMDNFAPHITFLLDLPPEIGLERATARGGDEMRFEAMDAAFHEKVRNGFLGLAKQEPKRFAVLNADNTAETLHQNIIETLNKRLELSLAASHNEVA